MSKFTVPNELVAAAKDQKSFVPKRQDRLYYRWEDDILESVAEVSFCFQSTFKEIDEEGNKSFI